MYRRDTIIPFIQTDFPDPVVPATNRCGIDARSTTIGFPDMLFPSAIGSFISFLLKLLDEIISDKITESLLELGISIPIVFFPGIIETLVDTELVFRAISSDKFIIFETLIPGAGSNSYKLTTGPLFIFVIFPLIPKSSNIFSMKSGFISFEIIFFDIWLCFFSNKFIKGNL